MQAHRSAVVLRGRTIIALVLMCAALQAGSYALAETVACDGTTISVNATDIKAEELIKTIGNTCGIRMELVGNVFNEESFSVQIEKMPMRTGLERVLRILKIPNHMMHFEGTGNSKRVVELSLIGEGRGERQLTSGSPPPAPERPARQEPKPASQPGGAAAAAPDQVDEKLQEHFNEVLDGIIEAQTEDGAEPDPAEVVEMFKQAVPEKMRGQIPAEMLQELEDMAEE